MFFYVMYLSAMCVCSFQMRGDLAAGIWHELRVTGEDTATIMPVHWATNVYVALAHWDQGVMEVQ